MAVYLIKLLLSLIVIDYCLAQHTADAIAESAQAFELKLEEDPFFNPDVFLFQRADGVD